MKLLDNTKVTRWNWFFLFAIIIYAASASEFVRNIVDPTAPGFICLFLIEVITLIKNPIKFNSKFFVILSIFLIYAVITTINNGHFSYGWIAKWIVTLFVAYTVCAVFKNKLFVAFESIMYFLCTVALFFWIVNLIIPDALTSFLSRFRFSNSYSEDFDTINIIFYTLNDEHHLNVATRLILRNAGFCWEPGAYSVFVCFAIYSNIVRSNFSFKNNRPLIIFIISLLSTQSTTGYFIFGGLLLGWLLINRKFLWGIVLIPCFLYVSTLPFMTDKVNEQQYSARMLDISEQGQNVNRFTAFAVYFDEFLDHPFVGLGGDENLSKVRRAGYDISLASGIGQLLALYGIVLTLLYLYLLGVSGAKLYSSTKNRNALLFYIPFTGLLISYVIWSLPLFMSFAITGYIGKINEEYDGILEQESL